MSNTNELAIEKQMPITAQSYKEGMANLAGAVNIVTTADGGEKVGFTATAVCSVSDSPATLLVCLNRNSSVYETFKTASTVAINTLASGQDDLSNMFGGKAPMAERFESGEWTKLQTGSPVLVGAAVSFDCQVSHRQSIATHDVFFCEVVALKTTDESGALLYYQRGYHNL
ncbi:flavin reductase [Marinomonas balearica]|uniref:Flavin reductase n=1 Tax=Marinomonas balearica TaxID=491947 RepID=A0A4R6MFH3_9GAMM|nr:flavin reductase [Marinomonas balearica]TDO99510.1 flavin reductase [Marinomonas balearica]